MTDASRSAIINAKPIGHGLDAFRDSARLLPLASVIFNPGASPDQVVSEGKVAMSALHLLTDIVLQDHALDLILALQALPASRSLSSDDNGKNFFGDLSRLNQAINAEIPMYNA